MQNNFGNLKVLKAGNKLSDYTYFKQKEENKVVKTIAKIAEKTANNSNSSCWFIGIYHQPKMPASLIKKDK